MIIFFVFLLRTHMKEQVNTLITDGGLGDLLCSLVAVNYNITHYKNIEFLLWVPDYMVNFTKHVLPKGTIVRPYSKAKNKYNDKLAGISTSWKNHTPMRTHPVDYAFHVLTDKHIYNLNEKNYLKIDPNKINIDRFKLPEKYVVINSTAAVKVKEMPVQTVNDIIDFVIKKGYKPVFLGKENNPSGVDGIGISAKKIEMNSELGINLINKTSLLESAAIIHKAKAIIGMDGGLIHLAGFTGTNIVAGYTLASPEHLAPIRNNSQTYKFYPIEPDLDIPNRYYQTVTNFNFDEDMREFPGWEKVIENMKSEKFIKVLEKIL